MTDTEKTPADHVNDLKVAGLALWDTFQDKIQAMVPPLINNEALNRLEALEAELASVKAENDALHAKHDELRGVLAGAAEAIADNEGATALWNQMDVALNA